MPTGIIIRSLEIQDIIFIIGFILFSLALGLIIYRLLAGFTWIDSYYNTTMVLSGAGPVDILPNNWAKFFAGTYAMYGGIFFLVVVTLIISRVAELQEA